MTELPEVRSIKVINHIISKLNSNSIRWCDSVGGCACDGCVNSVINKKEWDLWKDTVNYCECCKRFDDE